MKNASRASMLEILAFVEGELARGAETIELDVVDPDAGPHLHAGERIGGNLIHRPLRTWVDLAERLRLRLRTPRALDETPLVRLTFERLTLEGLTFERFEVGDAQPAADLTEKYGTASEFARIHKLEDARFLLDLVEAVDRVLAATPIARILDLGVNTGDELALLLARFPALRTAELVGIDHSASAIAHARERFAADPNVQVRAMDISAPLDVGRFDLVLSIGTLQSGALDDRDLLRRIVQDHLTPTGAVILGMPNCRYIDGEIEYGARIVNITQPELGLLIKDVAFYRKYLQQHHRHVYVTGKHYLFVTAVPITPHE